MQHLILSLAILLLSATITKAQCDKKINWHAGTAEKLNAEGQVLETKTGTILFETDTKKIRLSIVEAPDQTLEGTIKETTCNWKEAFKNGTTIYKTELFRNNGESSDGTFTIEAKEGKIIILMKIAVAEGNTWRITVNKYEEVK